MDSTSEGQHLAYQSPLPAGSPAGELTLSPELWEILVDELSARDGEPSTLPIAVSARYPSTALLAASRSLVVYAQRGLSVRPSRASAVTLADQVPPSRAPADR